MRINIIDKILMHIFKKYTYKIYSLGVQYGFNWQNEKDKLGWKFVTYVLLVCYLRTRFSTILKNLRQTKTLQPFETVGFVICMKLSLTKLWSLSCFLKTRFLSFLHSRISSQKTSSFNSRSISFIGFN